MQKYSDSLAFAGRILGGLLFLLSGVGKIV